MPLVSRFLAHLHLERGLSPNTVAAYGADVERFLLGLPEDQRRSPAAIDGAAVFAFLVSERRRGCHPRSVRRALAAVRTFFRFLVLSGEAARNPARFLDTPRIGRRLPSVLDEKEVARLLDASLDSDSRYAIRDRALLELLYACGLRVSEAVGLRLDDVHWELGVLRCMGKGSRERIVPVTRTALEAIRAYIDRERPRLLGARRRSAGGKGRPGAVASEKLLFLSRGGRSLGREVVGAILRKAVLRAGLSGRISPHTLRHSYATHLLHHGADLRIVQELLGHAKVQTTEIYTHVERSQLKDLHRKFHPRG
jgi:site-specific recombinase XerD